MIMLSLVIGFVLGAVFVIVFSYLFANALDEWEIGEKIKRASTAHTVGTDIDVSDIF